MNKSVITTSIFYSWQSDLDKKYNRYAIEASLKEAQKRLRQNQYVWILIKQQEER